MSEVESLNPTPDFAAGSTLRRVMQSSPVPHALKCHNAETRMGRASVVAVVFPFQGKPRTFGQLCQDVCDEVLELKLILRSDFRSGEES